MYSPLPGGESSDRKISGYLSGLLVSLVGDRSVGASLVGALRSRQPLAAASPYMHLTDRIGTASQGRPKLAPQ